MVIDTLLTHPVSQVAQATGVLSVTTATDVATSCIIATAVYLIQQGLIWLKNKVFAVKHVELGKK